MSSLTSFFLERDLASKVFGTPGSKFWGVLPDFQHVELHVLVVLCDLCDPQDTSPLSLAENKPCWIHD